jgi:hypothetical protein
MTPVIHPAIHRVIIAVTLALSASSALASASASGGDHAHTGGATKLWRCADASGHVGYSQQACDNSRGEAQDGRPMQVKDERTRAQQRESMDHQLRDLKLARQMRAERLHQERVARLDKAISLSGQGKPHVIKSTPNDHRPVPIIDSTRPIRVKAPKAKRGTTGTTARGELGTAAP